VGSTIALKMSFKTQSFTHFGLNLWTYVRTFEPNNLYFHNLQTSGYHIDFFPFLDHCGLCQICWHKNKTFGKHCNVLLNVSLSIQLNAVIFVPYSAHFRQKWKL
jgi:hypothetical protein